jgi:alanine racemase
VGRLTVDLRTLQQSYAALARAVAPASFGAIVTADACGLGAVQVVTALQAVGCHRFLVGRLDEALRLKPHLGEQPQLWVLHELLPGEEANCAAAGIVPVLHSAVQVERWIAYTAHNAPHLPLLLVINENQFQTGLSCDDLHNLAGGATGRRIELCVVTDGTQIAPAVKANAGVGDVPACLAMAEQSFVSRSIDGKARSFATTLHDVMPPGGRAPVVGLKVKVIQTRMVTKGAGIGYGGSHVATAPMHVATISAGYADGVPRSLSHRGSAFFRGVRLPFLGLVSMDSISVDITALPPDTIHPGDFVELIGPHQTLERLAADGGVSPSEILSTLGRRYQREYLR